jgi:tetratricopeptide (TPR) repeat protein
MLLKVGWFVALISVLFAGVSVAIATQQQVKKNTIVQTVTTAKIAVTDKEWTTVKEKNLELIGHDSQDANAWFMLGLARHYLGEYEESRKDWLKAEELGHEPGIVHYNLACSYARQNKTEQVIDEIKEAKELGFNVREFSETDPDLAQIRHNPEFQNIINQPDHTTTIEFR